MATAPQRLDEIIGERRIFATRFWGFMPDSWAAVPFPQERTVDTWISACPEGGFVLVFASHHLQEDVASEDRGRVFGILEFVAEKVACDDPAVIAPEHLSDGRNFAGGRFRWPYGLRVTQAWRFVDRNVLTREALPDARKEGFAATTSMVEMTDRDRAIINQYDLVEVPVLGARSATQRAPAPAPNIHTVHLLTCRDRDVLSRLPGWRAGELLFNVATLPDSAAGCAQINADPIARLIGLRFHEQWSRACASPEEAQACESAMHAAGHKHCRVAVEGQNAFYFAQETALEVFLAAAADLQ